MHPLPRQILTLCLLAAMPATLAAFLHPHPPAFRPPPIADGELPLSQLQTLGGPLLFIDARPRSAYQKDHLPQALWLTDDHWDDSLQSVLEVWKPGTILVVYCDRPDAADRRHVARRLKRETALPRIYALREPYTPPTSRPTSATSLQDQP